MWYYHNVEFIESQPFTRKLHRLAGDGADEVLRAIQGELGRKPDRGKGKRGGYRYLYLY